MTANELVLLGCGDVGPIHEPMAPYSSLVQPVLAGGDIRFAQCERVYSERGALQVHAGGGYSRLKPDMASVFSDCGFDVVSVAGNHAMDWGPEALLDSIDVLQRRGIKTIGAGRNLKEAREPAIIEHNGVRVAMLAYCSVLRDGYAAGPHSPGVAPLRAHTYYEPVEYQAGVPPRTITVPYAEDLNGMVQDIRDAKKAAHAVVVSLHWGIHFIPRLIADYQTIAANAAFEAEADLILGHHAHVPKAIGVHQGKVCFYSLSNFIMSAPAHATAFLSGYGVDMDPDYPRLPYGVDGKRSMIAKAVISRSGVNRVSFLPALIDKQLRPEVLRHTDPRFTEAVQYIEWLSEEFDHQFSIDADEVVVA